MSECKFCHKDMSADETRGCTGNEAITYADGETYPTVSYFNEYREDEPDHHCHDCNVSVGQKHHPGCDMEECPRCHGQLISCGCDNGDMDGWKVDKEKWLAKGGRWN